uniref:Uncharacterized protein n=1 Tax=Biomphalaria glabrata TaxID=6526 RepID=A0A2C9LMP1_BIOGL
MNYSKKFTICMLVYLSLIQQTKGAKEPPISDLTQLSRNCSNFCLPYGSCCTGFEFCHDGSCENCFPKTVRNEDLLTWCRDIGQHDSSQMRHRYSCIKACQNRFNAPDLMLCEETWKNVAISVIVLASVEGLLLLVCAVWIVKRYCALKGKKTQDSNPTEDGKVLIRTANFFRKGRLE